MSFAKYAQYRGSGVEWLGDVPAHWDISPFKRIVDIQNGADHKHVEVNEGIPVIGSGGQFAYASDFLYEGESVLLGRKGTIDKPLYVTGKFWTVDTMYWTKVAADAHGRFAYYSALTIPFGYYSTNTALPSMTKGTLSSHAIALPPLQEQRAIATFLDRETIKVDALVAEQQKLIALLKEKRQAIISHAVTKGLDPRAPMKDSGVEWLGEVPAHWTLRPIKYLVRMQSGGTPSKGNPDFWDGDIPWASAKDMKVDVLSDTEDHITASAVASGAASLVPESALVVVVRGMILAHTFPVAQLARSLSINQDLKALLPCDAITSGFLAWTLRGLSRETLDRVSEAGHGTCALRMEDWVSMILPVPPIEEQAEIEHHVVASLRRLDALIGEAQTATALLKERRTALISAAVTGKIDVREAVAVAEEVA